MGQMSRLERWGMYMRTKSKETENTIISFVDKFFDDVCRSPSLREIERGTNISRQTVQRYLKALGCAKIIQYDGKAIITEHIKEKTAASILHLPVIGPIACGSFSLEEQQTEGFLDFPASLLGSGKYFVLKAYGESMTNAGIDESDLVVVRSQSSANIGDIVVAIDDNNRNTLKRLMHNGVRYYLHPENEKYKDIYPNELRIQGVAVKIIKDVMR